jgi:hypothetical protein
MCPWFAMFNVIFIINPCTPIYIYNQSREDSPLDFQHNLLCNHSLNLGMML